MNLIPPIKNEIKFVVKNLLIYEFNLCAPCELAKTTPSTRLYISIFLKNKHFYTISRYLCIIVYLLANNTHQRSFSSPRTIFVRLIIRCTKQNNQIHIRWFIQFSKVQYSHMRENTFTFGKIFFSFSRAFNRSITQSHNKTVRIILLMLNLHN